MNDIAKRMLDSIKDSGLSYAELEKMTGIPKSALQRYATGVTEKIPMDRLQKISKALGIEAAYLMGWETNDEAEQAADFHATILKDEKLLEMIKEFYSLNPQQQENVRSIIHALAQTGR